ncbi:MAG: CsgG/HfaB family protein [Burkholderiaceae bacterium]|nr:CsgG/HfaB family protein [Burkholderiaceae bacterium]
MNRVSCSLASAALAFALLQSPYDALAQPQTDASSGAQQLKKLPRKQGERVAVTIYEFRSMLPALSARTATDMFTTALVQSGQFRVVERGRVNEGVVREKQLQQAGWATGNAAQQPLRGAQYIFEGTVSEANVQESANSGGINIAGMQIGGGKSQDSIVIDLRIIDAANGDVLDALTVRKPVVATSAGVNGVGSLAATILGRRGKDTTYVPDVQAQNQQREGIDGATRAAIEEAVLQLAKRFEP